MHKFVMEQVRVLGIVQTCEVLKHVIRCQVCGNKNPNLSYSKIKDKPQKKLGSSSSSFRLGKVS
jgi:hypothetical protein